MSDILRHLHDLTPQPFGEGQALLREGDETGALFVLRSGAVRIVRDGVTVATLSGPGAVFGEMSLLLDRPHSASVIAAQPVEAYVLAGGLEALRNRPGLALHVLQLVAQRLENTTALVGRLKHGAAEKRHDTGLFERLIGFLTGQVPGGRPPAQPRPR